jgi:flagellar biogenesis protein FliO
LRLCENLQLGDRRFLSIIECGRQKFLVGGTPNSLAMLAVLPGTDCFPPDMEELPTWKTVEGELIREARHG